VARALANDDIADRLLALSGLLELADASPHAVRAYRRASDLVRAAPTPVAELVRAGRARELRGIGPGIERRLRELVETGELAELRELDSTLRPELIGLGRMLGLGTRRMLDIDAALKIEDAAGLRRAAEQGLLTTVPGIGPATEGRIRAALEEAPRPRQGLTLNRALPLVEGIASALGGHAAGDPRRFCELSFDLAVVCAADVPAPFVERFEQQPAIVTLLERAGRQAVGLTVEGVPVTLVVAEPGRLGTELVRATGSAAYVESLGPLPAASTEEAVYRALGLPWRPPELRELPAPDIQQPLVELADVRGDLHCHTTWSDGRASVEDMGRAARDRGYDYLAVCDHTSSVRVVPGLDADDVRRQGDEIASANEALAPFRVLRGIECDILPGGGLDLPDDVLAELDWVQASLHAGQRLPRPELTRVVVEAMRNPYVSALSHPTGRLLNRRPENALDLERVFEVAVETGVALEINGLPDRLDLSSANATDGLRAGVQLVASSDAHSEAGLARIELAVATARRAGAPAERIVNTLPPEGLLERRTRAAPVSRSPVGRGR
jgi:DNA polymerase (family 10)